jgi:Flp pilus assembly protein TadD
LVLCADISVVMASHVYVVNAQSGTSDERDTYSGKAAKSYNYRFGKDHPFLPSNIETKDGQFIDPKTFPTAQYCGHCHQEAHAQWRQSAHSNSNRAPWYLKNVGLLNTEKGIEFSRHCEGCHDPIAVVARALTQGASIKRPYDQDGVTCMVCHSIQKVDTRGTGSFVLAVPAVLLDEKGEPVTRPVGDAEILAHLDRHSAAVMKDFYRTSEFCAACHKAALSKELNAYKWQRAISLYDEWQNSSFATQSPLPFYRKDNVSTCQTCHMPREKLAGHDYGAKDGMFASHRWLGANTMVPKYYGFDDQMAKVIAFLQNSVLSVDIFAVALGSRPAMKAQPVPQGCTISTLLNENLIVPLGLTRFDLNSGVLLTVSVVVQNKGIAHSHVPEQRDMYESWIDFTVKDAAGKTLAESGALEPDGTLDPGAHSFTNRLVNKNTSLNGLHEVWNNRVVAYNNTIQSGRSQLVRYSFTMPQASAGSVTVTATVKYRRFDQHFIDFGMRKGYEQPVVDMASASRTFMLGVNEPAPPAASENKEWMRWNNYGVALLDEQQYAASVDAFRHVAALRPDYADAYTNIAIAYLQSERYNDALLWLTRSLGLAPGNARALYYRALVKRHKGDVDGAIADLQIVASEFPRSRDTHRELGYCYYQKEEFDLARAEYEKLQGIDPDDLSAHYNLSILYRRFGLKDKALEQANYFADQKDDPAATTFALEYLRQHPEVEQEGTLGHVHDLDAHGNQAAVSSVQAVDETKCRGPRNVRIEGSLAVSIR